MHTGGRESEQCVIKWQDIKLWQKSLKGGLLYTQLTVGSGKLSKHKCNTSTSSIKLHQSEPTVLCLTEETRNNSSSHFYTSNQIQSDPRSVPPLNDLCE